MAVLKGSDRSREELERREKRISEVVRRKEGAEDEKGRVGSKTSQNSLELGSSALKGSNVYRG